MAILAGDIKLVASAVMDDVEEGGGAPTSTIITDGTSNSIFNDISELDRAGGRVSLRKVFAHVQTNNTETYLGSNVIVADMPDDPNVSVTIFKAKDVFDVRNDAENRIETYLNKASYTDGYLLENHVAGQRTIQLFQREQSQPPTIGTTLALIYHEGMQDEREQYVRITKVESEVRTFSYFVNGYIDFTARVTTCELSDLLRYDFPGSPPHRSYQMAEGKTAIRDTVVADAALYYGASPTTDPVTLGDVSASVESIFTKLVPSAQTETTLTDLTAGGASVALVKSATGSVSYTTNNTISASSALNVGLGIEPGTLNITFSGGSIHDDGGQLVAGSTVIGTVNYAQGTIILASSAPSYIGTKTIAFTPAAAPVRVMDTAGIHVRADNRAYNYQMTIVPPPAPGSLTVSYRAQGQWYTLQDNGSGALRGSDTAYGAGSISFATGTASVTLGALPDIGSEIIYAWGSTVNYRRGAGLTVLPGAHVFTLSHTGLTPGSLTISWNDGSPRTALDNGSGGFTGDAIGRIDYSTGRVVMAATHLPQAAQEFTAVYSYGPPETETFPNPGYVGNLVNVQLSQTNLIPGSVKVVFQAKLTNNYWSNMPADMLAHKPGGAVIMSAQMWP